jgi:hypothetical protein
MFVHLSIFLRMGTYTRSSWENVYVCFHLVMHLYGINSVFTVARSQLELWVTSRSDTPRLQYYDVHTLEYRYISKLLMKKEQI